MSTFMLQLVGLWIVMVLVGLVIYEVRDDWRA
jgi:hypothetical protein